jgi:hypothetical protein
MVTVWIKVYDIVEWIVLGWDSVHWRAVVNGSLEKNREFLEQQLAVCESVGQMVSLSAR